jgi:3',5'-cyclic AMP phosphodiesterase CpdA
MFRMFRPTTAIGLLAFATMACAGSPEGTRDESAARAVPNLVELSSWLEGESHSDAGRPNYFIQMADTQLGMSEYSLPFLLMGATWNDDQFETDARLFEAAVRHANELKPSFVIVCGDLVNRVGHAGQIAEFQRIAATLDPLIPFYVIAGNHDVGDEPTKETLRAYRSTFGPDRYSFRDGGIHGIVLNSQIIDAPENVPEEADRQLTWLRKELKSARASDAEHIIVFLHQSFFLETPDEDDQYFNIEQAARAVYLDLFKRAGVEAVLAGHYHRNAAGVDGDLQMITTGPVGRPLGDDPSGFRIFEVRDDSIRQEYFSLGTR